MKRLLSFLLSGCWHEWEILNDVNLTYTGEGKVISTGRRYIVRCKRCGEIKKVDLM